MLASATSDACPSCNIYNYLAESVVQSTNVFVGKLFSRVNDNECKAEVVRTLLGPYRPGQIIELRAWTRAEDTGKFFIFSDPWDAPGYPMLEPDFEDEVRLILRLIDLQIKARKGKFPNIPRHLERLSAEMVRQYQVTNVDEAIRHAQGWSNESKEIGINYLAKAKPFPSRKIIEAIEPIRSGLLAGKEIHSTGNRLGNLVEALMISDAPEAEGYVLSQVKACLKQKGQVVDWARPPLFATLKGEWLAELVGLSGKDWTHRHYAGGNPHRKAHPQLAAKQKQMLLDALPKLHGILLSESVYALCETKIVTPQQLLPLLTGTQSKDDFALGVFWSVRHKISPMSGEKSDKPLTDLELIATLVTEPELKKQIAEAIQYVRKRRPATEKK